MYVNQIGQSLRTEYSVDKLPQKLKLFTTKVEEMQEYPGSEWYIAVK
jgi:hypothetical protein